jgi:hypothetical protein
MPQVLSDADFEKRYGGAPPAVISDAEFAKRYGGGSVAEKAAARLPRMRQEEQAAQTDVQNDTIGKGLGQAAGSAVFGLGADVMAKELDHPIASALTMGQYPILASMLPGMVNSAGNQVGKAVSDARTAISGSAGPNLPPATLPERGEAAARVLPRLGFATLAPLGIAGIADQADAIKTAPDPMAAAGRTFGSAAITAGAIPASRLVSPMVKQSGANMSGAAADQMRGIFTETPENAPLLDRAVPELLDKRVTFSSGADLPRRVAGAVSTPGPTGKPVINAQGMRSIADAQALSSDVRVPGERPAQPPAITPREILMRGAMKAASKVPVLGPIGKVALDTVRALADSPAWNSFSAVQKARLGSLMESGAYGDALTYAGELSQIHNANDAQGNYYQKLMTRVPDATRR